MSAKNIYYSDKYDDELYEYRHVMLPKDIAKMVPKTHLMSESEWRNLGVQQSQGWVHYMIHEPGKCINLPASPAGYLEFQPHPQHGISHDQMVLWVYGSDSAFSVLRTTHLAVPKAPANQKALVAPPVVQNCLLAASTFLAMPFSLSGSSPAVRPISCTETPPSPPGSVPCGPVVGPPCLYLHVVYVPLTRYSLLHGFSTRLNKVTRFYVSPLGVCGGGGIFHIML
uniref:Cyclin-dependent kinases regulatory subunit n=1 Tax=Xenopus tropicalis TaxID=8364 RepID=A0A803J9U2_XENTR